MPRTLLTTITPAAYRVLLTTAKPSATRVVPIDATWFMPNVARDAQGEFQTERIPQLKFFDLDKYVSPSTYPHMLPDVAVMREAFRDLKLRQTDSLVVYDKLGVFLSPRAAFTFALFGHPKVYLLDNYLGYKLCEYPLEETPVKENVEAVEVQEEEYEFALTPEQLAENYRNQVVEYDELLELVKSGGVKEYLLLDARSKERFTGEADEPRPGLSSGHVPGAVNLPFGKLLDPKNNNQYKSKEEVEEIFKELTGLDDLKDLLKKYPKGVIVMCGTGVTAVILKFAIDCILKLNVPVRVYDGSWTEWASRAPSEYIQKDI
ncbi:Thiosulfate sulfurtransferase TUM1 [Candida viswanathii]|uniref:Sulfurtransferase n=1 Tax=Candida viswanathii TaxID=5486 RepID=A0A367XPF3_9ASCO|nr:Thiosulfate sulfurtransferase TUM1 [Candida viswanathii]